MSYYSKTKCPCIAHQEIIGLGNKTDEHLTCHSCGSPLFPTERYTKFCNNCRTNPYMDDDEVKDRLQMWGFPDSKEFARKKQKEESKGEMSMKIPQQTMILKNDTGVVLYLRLVSLVIGAILLVYIYFG